MDETTTTKLFGWSLSSLIVVMLVLNAISYWRRRTCVWRNL